MYLIIICYYSRLPSITSKATFLSIFHSAAIKGEKQPARFQEFQNKDEATGVPRNKMCKDCPWRVGE